MTRPARATIDGREVEVRPGETILTALRRLGLDVPTLCHRPGLEPEGGCRLCLVETDRGLRAACHGALEPEMVVETATAELEALRRDLLSLILAERGPGIFEADGSGDELERLLARYGLGEPDFGYFEGENGTGQELDSSHPYLRFDAARCIACRRCVHACEEWQGQFVYAMAGRGAATRLVFGPAERFAESPCVACGACVDVCPTEAVTDRDRLGRPAEVEHTDSVCGYCGVGCRVSIESAGGRVVAISGVKSAAVNHGHLCVKGRYAHAYHHSEERLTRPLLRDGDGFREISWAEALDHLAERLVAIRDRHGPEALGVFTSSRSTNEAAYLLQKLFRALLGSNNVDCCARVCHSSTALALQLVTGTGAASASYEDIERAGAFVVAGANPTEAHPVVGARIKEAVLRSAAPLLVIDPRRIELTEYAAVHLQLRPGTNVPLMNGLARVLFEEELVDREFLAERVEGLEEFESFVRGRSLESAAEVTGVPADEIRRAARLLGRAGPALFVHGLGLSELTQGTASVMALCNLGMLTGSIGRPGAGMLPLRGQNNVQGNADMGGMPNQVTGYQSLADEEVRARLERLWGKAPPSEPGLTIPEMIDGAARGEIRGLWIQGEDVVQSDPNRSHVIEALENLDFLVVQELFLTETAQYAHLVLPAAGALEQAGTFTNGERRIQLVRPAVGPPGEARADWRVAVDLARRLGARWDYPSPAEVMDEIARAAPRLFGGVSYRRLEGDGLQWPCPEPGHGGTSTVHAEGFLRGKGKLMAIDHEPSPEHGVEGYPYLLVTGRVLDHYNVGTMTRRTPSREIVGEDRLEIHPEDAQREGLGEGQEVGLESRWGEVTVRAYPSARVAQGTLFLSFHFPETRTNALTGPQVDPQSKCPEYKVTAVRFAS